MPGAHTYDCAGLFGLTCQTVNPRWHHIFRTTWDTAWNFRRSAHLALHRLVRAGQQYRDPTLHYATWGAYDYYNAKIPAYNYIDLAATWNVNKILQIRAGANNVLDKDPPMHRLGSVSGGAANTYSVYDHVRAPAVRGIHGEVLIPGAIEFISCSKAASGPPFFERRVAWPLC